MLVSTGAALRSVNVPVGMMLSQSWLVHNELELDRILMATFAPDIVNVQAVCVVDSARSIWIGPPAMPFVTLGVTWTLEAGQGPLGIAFALTAWPVDVEVGAAGVLAAVCRGAVVFPVSVACGGFEPPPLNIATIAISRTIGVPNTTARRRQYTAAGSRLAGRRGGVRRAGPLL